MAEVKRIFCSVGTSAVRSRTFGRRTASAPIPVWMLRSGPMAVPHNTVAAVRQDLFGMARNESVSLGPQPSRQNPSHPVTRDLGQRIIHRFRLTQGDDVCIVLHGVSFLLEVLAGLSTRHDTPPSQTPSPISRLSSPHFDRTPKPNQGGLGTG